MMNVMKVLVSISLVVLNVAMGNCISDGCCKRQHDDYFKRKAQSCRDTRPAPKWNTDHNADMMDEDVNTLINNCPYTRLPANLNKCM